MDSFILPTAVDNTFPASTILLLFTLAGSLLPEAVVSSVLPVVVSSALEVVVSSVLPVVVSSDLSVVVSSGFVVGFSSVMPSGSTAPA